MSEETPFKSIKITLSEEALDMLAILRKKGYFRSDSMAIEESIRTVYAVSGDLEGMLLYLGEEKRGASPQEMSEWLRRVTHRVTRFMSRDKLAKLAKVDFK
ncbi:MAG: hypothetical protein OEX01_06495 [Candidatus Bathyarchaeota archaeon]|nr:hypothetical protein [Candidatus Bathyarchaeota archaeon]